MGAGAGNTVRVSQVSGGNPITSASLLPPRTCTAGRGSGAAAANRAQVPPVGRRHLSCRAKSCSLECLPKLWNHEKIAQLFMLVCSSVFCPSVEKPIPFKCLSSSLGTKNEPSVASHNASEHNSLTAASGTGVPGHQISDSLLTYSSVEDKQQHLLLKWL